jgi:hypothetical protein
VLAACSAFIVTQKGQIICNATPGESPVTKCVAAQTGRDPSIYLCGIRWSRLSRRHGPASLDDETIDIATFRKSRLTRLREQLRNLFGWILKRGWIEVEASVDECGSSSYRYYLTNSRNAERLPYGGYSVSFTYVVDGKTYKGITTSPDEMQREDKFHIRCNPKHPEENNTFYAETNWVVTYSYVIGGLFGLWALVAVVLHLFFRR